MLWRCETKVRDILRKRNDAVAVARELMSVRGMDFTIVPRLLKDLGYKVVEENEIRGPFDHYTNITERQIRHVYQAVIQNKNFKRYEALRDFEDDLLLGKQVTYTYERPAKKKFYEYVPTWLRYATVGLTTAALGIALTVGSFVPTYKTKQPEERKPAASSLQKTNPPPAPNPQPVIQQVKKADLIQQITEAREATPHKVKEGESLSLIAFKEYKTKKRETWKWVKHLISKNKDRYPSLIENPDLIYPGMEIRL